MTDEDEWLAGIDYPESVHAEEHKLRARLSKVEDALIDLLDAVDGVSVYPEGSFGFEELAVAQERTEQLLRDLDYELTDKGWRRRA